jgi:hypothetical protein
MPSLTRRSLLAAAGAAALAPPLWRTLQQRGYDNDRRRAYEALVAALADHGALPGDAGAGDRLADLYRESLPRRRREIDQVLDALAHARLAERTPKERVALLRDWAAAGGERRALAARALALAGAAYGPAERPLTVAV